MTSIRSSQAGFAWARSACIRLSRVASRWLGRSASTASRSMSLTAASKSPAANDPNRYRPTRDDPVMVAIASRMETSKEPTAGSDVDGLQSFMDKCSPASASRGDWPEPGQVAGDPPERGRCGCLTTTFPVQEGHPAGAGYQHPPPIRTHRRRARPVQPCRGGAAGRDGRPARRDLVVMLADGGDCVSDLAVLGDQAGLFGRVCSTATAWRVVGEVAADPRGVAALWSALARVRERAWAAGAALAGPLRIDIDATLVDAHCDKQGAAGTVKHRLGVHPPLAWVGPGGGTRGA